MRGISALYGWALPPRVIYYYDEALLHPCNWARAFLLAWKCPLALGKVELTGNVLLGGACANAPRTSLHEVGSNMQMSAHAAGGPGMGRLGRKMVSFFWPRVNRSAKQRQKGVEGKPLPLHRAMWLRGTMTIITNYHMTTPSPRRWAKNKQKNKQKQKDKNTHKKKQTKKNTHTTALPPPTTHTGR